MTAPIQRRAGRRGLFEMATVARSFARAHFELRGTRRGARVRCYGGLLVPRRDGIVIGPRVSFLAGSVRTSLRCEAGAELVIGARTIFNYGVEIAASRSVRIGDDCMVGSFVHIRDDDGRRSIPVVIGNRVWIAHGAVIAPGASIGDGAVIAAMAVVTGVVPAGSLAAGNPAQSMPLEGPTAARSAAADLLDDVGVRPSSDERDDARANPSPDELDDVRPRPSPDEVRAAILEWFDDTRLFGDAAKLITSDAMSLRDHGLLDSLGLVQLLLMLEGRFGVAINRQRAASPGAQNLKGWIDFVVHPERGSS